MKTYEQRNGVMCFGGITHHGEEVNANLYPPGMPCEAMHGCPVNPNCWSLVCWFPGKDTVMLCFPQSADGQAWIKARLR
jgi:hypothetical protein